MKKTTFLLFIAACALFTGCDKSNKPIDWQYQSWITFNSIQLKADANVYYPINGIAGASAGAKTYISNASPVTSFYEVYSVPYINLGNSTNPNDRLLNSKITAITIVDSYNPKFPNDILEHRKDFDGRYNYNGNSLPGLSSNSLQVWSANNRDPYKQHLDLTIVSGPLRRDADNAHGNLYWTRLFNSNNSSTYAGEYYDEDNKCHAYFKKNVGAWVEIAEFQEYGVFKIIQSTPFVNRIFIEGAYLPVYSKMTEINNEMKLSFSFI
ncbi:MAG: hypothetical protein LBN95_10640 [Prevotellaceae bacterium]|jgi:hypothetical protein|nr:hypothetical protein [Prevotellaceae bacterium]